MTKQDISRRDLYELVWKEPVEDIAKRFGLSGRGLAKLCERHSIPVPERGYWQKKAAGKAPSKRPPLIELPGDREKRLDHQIQTAMSNSAVQPRETVSTRKEPSAFETIYKAEAAENRVIPVPSSLSKLHPIVSQWIAESGRSASALTKTEPLQARSYRISSALLVAFEAAGFRLSRNQNDWSFCVLFRSVALEMIIRERILQRRQPISDEERREGPWVTGKWRQVKVPTGELTLTLEHLNGPSLPKDVPSSWADTATTQLEGKLGDVIAATLAHVAFGEHSLAVERDRFLEAERQRQIAEDRKREREREEQRRSTLRANAEAWREAANLRAYVQAVQTAAAAGKPPKLPTELNEWTSWALTVANDLDPLNGRSDWA